MDEMTGGDENVVKKRRSRREEEEEEEGENVVSGCQNVLLPDASGQFAAGRAATE